MTGHNGRPADQCGVHRGEQGPKERLDMESWGGGLPNKPSFRSWGPLISPRGGLELG